MTMENINHDHKQQGQQQQQQQSDMPFCSSPSTTFPSPYLSLEQLFNITFLQQALSPADAQLISNIMSQAPFITNTTFDSSQSNGGNVIIKDTKKRPLREDGVTVKTEEDAQQPSPKKRRESEESEELQEGGESSKREGETISNSPSSSQSEMKQQSSDEIDDHPSTTQSSSQQQIQESCSDHLLHRKGSHETRNHCDSSDMSTATPGSPAQSLTSSLQPSPKSGIIGHSSLSSNPSSPVSMPIILATIEEEIKKSKAEDVPQSFRFFCLGLLTAVCAMGETSTTNGVDKTSSSPPPINHDTHTNSSSNAAALLNQTFFNELRGACGEPSTTGPTTIRSLASSPATTSSTPPASSPSNVPSLFAIPMSSPVMRSPDALPSPGHPLLNSSLSPESVYGLLAGVHLPQQTSPQASLPLLYSAGILQELLMSKNGNELSQALDLATQTQRANEVARLHNTNGGEASIPIQQQTTQSELRLNGVENGIYQEVRQALAQAFSQQMTTMTPHNTMTQQQQQPQPDQGFPRQHRVLSTTEEQLILSQQPSKARKRKVKGDRTPPEEFLADFLDLRNEGLSENEIREYYRSCGSDLLPMYFTVDKNTIRYRNIENGIKIWLKINEELVFGLLVAFMLESPLTQRLEYLRPNLLQLDKDKLLDAARHWEDRAFKASRENYLKILDSVNRALEFCSIEGLPIRGLYYMVQPTNVAVHTKTPEEIVRGLLNITSRNSSHGETDINNYLISLGPSPLPPQFCFTRSSMRVHYRNLQRKLYVTLRLNSELIFGLMIAAMISNPLTDQFNDLRWNIQQLDRTYMDVVIQLFKEKSPPGVTLYRVNAAANALQTFMRTPSNHMAITTPDSSSSSSACLNSCSTHNANHGEQQQQQQQLETRQQL